MIACCFPNLLWNHIRIEENTPAKGMRSAATSEAPSPMGLEPGRSGWWWEVLESWEGLRWRLCLREVCEPVREGSKVPYTLPAGRRAGPLGGPEDVDGGGGVLASGRCEEEVTRLERGATAAAVAASCLSCCFTEWVCYNTNEKNNLGEGDNGAHHGEGGRDGKGRRSRCRVRRECGVLGLPRN